MFSLFALLFLSGCSNTAVNINPLNDDGTAAITVDIGHDQLHTGQIYSTQARVTIGAGQTKWIKATPINTNMHLKKRNIAITSTGAIEFETKLYEGATDTNTGTQLNVYNKHRGYADDSQVLFYTGVTGVDTASATELPFNNHLESDKKFSISSAENIEYILTENKSYYLELVNNNGGTLDVIITWDWVEE